MKLIKLIIRIALVLALPVAPIEIIMDGWERYKKEWKEQWNYEI